MIFLLAVTFGFTHSFKNKIASRFSSLSGFSDLTQLVSLFGIPKCLLNPVFVARYVGAASTESATSIPDAALLLVQSSS